jgi:hypothetical protein
MEEGEMTPEEAREKAEARCDELCGWDSSLMVPEHGEVQLMADGSAFVEVVMWVPPLPLQ